MNSQQLAYKIAFGNALHGNKAKLSKEGGKWTIKLARKQQ